ncbi:hypothetical protein ILUMI_24099 [Ignelater luminosus]|uniref:Uncharacterized protein n=1 Tax=Ignelater luminosus TaxID=2038154 RepID=A0A8K0CAX5_IGNLU|nr:hypothetical protein ILUMI_24099 [Ignelater luminosus]
MEQALEENAPRRSLRRAVLAPLDNTTTVLPNNAPGNPSTPQISADEYIIEHRGRRKKPITWSPVDYNKLDVLGPPRDKTPERVPQRPDISSKLRRRLTMSPVKDNSTSPLGDSIAKKLKALSNISGDFRRRELQ